MEKPIVAVGVSEAKAQLSKLLFRVCRGESILITKRGRPIARLLPPGQPKAISIREVIRQMEKWQASEGPVLGPEMSIRQMREDGRRS
jgi:prevent-host-death family protein